MGGGPVAHAPTQQTCSDGPPCCSLAARPGEEPGHWVPRSAKEGTELPVPCRVVREETVRECPLSSESLHP